MRSHLSPRPGTTRARPGPSRTLHRAASLLLGLFLLTSAFPGTLVHAQSGWQPLVDGIAYHEFSLPGPNRAYVARMDRSNPNLIIDSGIAQGRVGAGKETVSQIARRYDQAISTWGGVWGPRNRVVVAINGSFYDTTTGIPYSGMVHSGVYTKWYGDLGGSSGFAWTLERQAFIGQCVYHRPEKQVLTYLATGNQQTIQGIDAQGEEDDLVLFTPGAGFDGMTRPGSLNLRVELSRPLLILPLPAMVRGTIRELREDVLPPNLAFDGLIVSAAGAAREILEANARVGDTIGISLEITDLGPDCNSWQSQDWTKTYAGVSGSFDFLLDGELQDFADLGATTRHPRTAICFNDDWIYFVVVDGRDPGRSLGMTIEELGRFCRDSLGARWGINQDGGGSSTLWAEGQVRNLPSDGTERQVANALMMIKVEPPENSTRFVPGQPVVVGTQGSLRLGPGDNYPVVAQLPANILGEIVHHTDTSDGVLARGEHWWEVAFSQTQGWVREAELQDLTRAPSALWPDIWPYAPR